MSLLARRRRSARLLASALALVFASGCSEASNRRRTVSPSDGARLMDAAVSEQYDASMLSNIGSACASASSCRAPSMRSKPMCLHSVDPAASLQGGLAAIQEALGGTTVDGSVELDIDGGEQLALPDLSVDLRGGYCSATCRIEDDCGRGAACVGLSAFVIALGLADAGTLGGFVDEPGVCLEPCDRDSDCREREGYVCRSVVEDLLPDAWLLTVIGTTELPPPYHCLPPR